MQAFRGKEDPRGWSREQKLLDNVSLKMLAQFRDVRMAFLCGSSLNKGMACAESLKLEKAQDIIIKFPSNVSFFGLKTTPE